MTQTTAQDPQPQVAAAAALDAVDDQLAAQLVAQARSQGISLVGPDGLLQQVTKLVLEGELTDHLATSMAIRPAAMAATPPGGTRTNTVLTDIGPIQLQVPRDRDATFQPTIVRKRQRRLGGVDGLVVSLVAKGLTTGEAAAHLAEVYGTEVSRQTISVITDRVLEDLAAWQSRPLDAVHPVLFIDAINVKIRDGSVANRPIYVALGVTANPNGAWSPSRRGICCWCWASKDAACTMFSAIGTPSSAGLSTISSPSGPRVPRSS
jgi:putative transposase